MLLPADDWYYTNHSTRFGLLVKQHAARVLIYIGLGDRVGNRVNLFTCTTLQLLHREEFQNFMHISAAPQVSSKSTAESSQNSANEDEYILEVLQTPNVRQEVAYGIGVDGSDRAQIEFSRTSRSPEGILLKIIDELNRGGSVVSTTEVTNGETGAPGPSYAVLNSSKPVIQPTNCTSNCILEECEDKPVKIPFWLIRLHSGSILVLCIISFPLYTGLPHSTSIARNSTPTSDSNSCCTSS